MATEVARKKLILVWLHPTVGEALLLHWSMFQFNTFSESIFTWHFLMGLQLLVELPRNVKVKMG